jgi:hypothetical protein
MSPTFPCPRCHSTKITTRNIGRNTGGAVGTIAGAAGSAAAALGGAETGAVIGMVAGPVGSVLGGWPVLCLEHWLAALPAVLLALLSVNTSTTPCSTTTSATLVVTPLASAISLVSPSIPTLRFT